MPEIIAVVEEKTSKEKGGYKLTTKTDNGQTRTLHIASNYEGEIPNVGEWGKYEYSEWKPDSWGADKSAMKMVDGWGKTTAPATEGGAHIPTSTGYSQSTPRTAIEITATELSSQAAQIVHHLIDIGAVKEIGDAQAYWLSLTTDAIALHRQIIKEEA